MTGGESLESVLRRIILGISGDGVGIVIVQPGYRQIRGRRVPRRHTDEQRRFGTLRATFSGVDDGDNFPFEYLRRAGRVVTAQTYIGAECRHFRRLQNR